MAGGLETSGISCFVPGEASGDSEGNDSRVFAEFGVTKDCLRDLGLAVLDLRETLEICEVVLLRS